MRKTNKGLLRELLNGNSFFRAAGVQNFVNSLLDYFANSFRRSLAMAPHRGNISADFWLQSS